MSKLFKTNNKIRKKHKKSLFDLGRTRFPKKLAQKLFATTVCIAMVLCTMPRGWGSYEVHAVDTPEVTLTVDFGKNPPTITGAEGLRALGGVTARVRVTLLNVPPGAAEVDLLMLSTVDDTVSMIRLLWPRWEGEIVTAIPTSAALLCIPRMGVRGWQDWLTSQCVAVDVPLGVGCAVGRQGVPEPLCGGGDVTRGVLLFAVCSRYSTRRGVAFGEEERTLTIVPTRNEYRHLFVDADDLPRGLKGDSFLWTTVDGDPEDEWDLTGLPWTNWPGGVTGRANGGNETNDNDNDYIETTVTVNGKQQRIRVYDPNGVLPPGATLSAERVTADHADHNFFVNFVDGKTDVEERYCYNLYLKNGDTTLSDLGGEVEVRFECPSHMDSQDTTVVHVSEGTDDRLPTRVDVDEDGTLWMCAKTSSFSPYVLEDALTERDVAENSRNTIITVTVVGVGIVLILALGVFLRRMKKKKLEN